jgi:hypothetical protein
MRLNFQRLARAVKSRAPSLEPRLFVVIEEKPLSANLSPAWIYAATGNGCRVEPKSTIAAIFRL